jgi:uncharacterized membrane protein YhaH (DUF805 family)
MEIVDVMSRLDITFCQLILVGGGLIIIVVELCLLADELLTGASFGFPAWARCLGLLAGLALIVAVLAVRVKRKK